MHRLASTREQVAPSRCCRQQLVAGNEADLLYYFQRPNDQIPCGLQLQRNM